MDMVSRLTQMIDQEICLLVGTEYIRGTIQDVNHREVMLVNLKMINNYPTDVFAQMDCGSVHIRTESILAMGIMS